MEGVPETSDYANLMSQKWKMKPTYRLILFKVLVQVHLCVCFLPKVCTSYTVLKYATLKNKGAKQTH